MATSAANVRKMTADEVQELNQRIALARGWRPAPYAHSRGLSGWTAPGGGDYGGWLHLPSYTGGDAARSWELAVDLLQHGVTLDRQWLLGDLALNVAHAWHDLFVEIGA